MKISKLENTDEVRSSEFFYSKSPALIFLFIASTIFLAEAIIMLLLKLMPHKSFLVEALTDAALLVVFISPALYVFLFRPMVTHIRERKRIEETLHRNEEEQFRVMIRTSLDGFCITDARGRFFEVNDAFCSMTGYRREELLDMSIVDVDALDILDIAARYTGDLTELGGGCFETLYRCKDGSILNIEVSANYRNLHGGRSYCFLRDITERKQTQEELRIAATAFETDEGIVITDKNATIIRVNRAFTHLSGYSEAEAIGKTPALLKSGRQDTLFYSRMWNKLLHDKYWQGEIWNRRKNGEIFPEWLTITGVTDENGNLTHYVGVFSDITERKLAEEKISFLAYHDKLTGLPNRALFYDRLSRAMSQARRNIGHFVLLFLDLDGFKAVNDYYGHEVGDEVLKEAARRLLACVRDVDTVARLGGDEFAIVLDGIEQPADIISVAQKIIQKLVGAISLADNLQCSVGVSIGIAIYPDDGAEIDRLVSAADAAMYDSKSYGKGVYTFYKRTAPADTAPQSWIVFDDGHLLGVPEIDQYHLELVELLNKLNAMVISNKSEPLIRQAFNDFVKKVRLHFESEELLMEESGYKGKAHKQEHQRLLAEFGVMKNKFFEGGESMILLSLKEWLLGHILHADRDFANFFIQNKAGQ